MKKYKYLSLIAASFLFGMGSVFAAPTHSISAKSQVEVGQNVTATVTVKNAAAWNIKVNGTGNTNGCSAHEADASKNGNNITKSVSVTCHANSTGVIRIAYSGDATSADGSTVNLSGSKVINVVAARQKSTNNYLKSLSVNDGVISPEFKKDTLEYSVTFEPGTEKVTINAEKEDGYASLTGTGEKDVVEGDNKFEIIVTSETGSARTYVLNVIVKEFSPINVTVSKKDYTVVRRVQELTKPETFEDTTVDINGEQVPAFYNESLNKTLVGLKDSEGNIYLFEYKDGKYSRYYEFKFEGLTINIIDMDKSKLPNNYKEYTHFINNEEMTVYKLNAKSYFAIVYGINLATGEKDLYQVDIKNNTIQRYNSENSKVIKDNNTKSLMIISSLGAIILLEFIAILSLKSKNKKIINRIKNDKIEKVKKSAIKESKNESIDRKDVKTEEIKVDDVSETILDDNENIKKKKKSK